MKLTRLRAINRMLRGAGLHPVSSLQDEANNETLIASDILDDALLEHQLQGLFGNTRVMEDVSPDEDGHIILPADTLLAEAWGSNRHRNFDIEVIDDAVHLVDRDQDESQEVFSSINDNHLTIRVIYFKSFEDLAPHQQFRVVDFATVEFQQHTMGDPEQTSILMRKSQQSRMQARAHDMRMRRWNFFRDSPDASAGRYNRYPRRRW